MFFTVTDARTSISQSAAALCRQMEANIKIMFFWSSTTCRLPNMYKLFGKASFVHLHCKLFYPEHAANLLLRNISALMSDQMALDPRWP